MVRSKLRRFGSLALILVLLCGLLVPSFIVSPAAITQEEFLEYCKYGVFTDCQVTFKVEYIDLYGDDQEISNILTDVPKIYGGIYFNDIWSNIKHFIQQDYGEPYEVTIDISFAVPFSAEMDLASFMINGFESEIDIAPSFYTVDGSSITCYDLSTSPEGMPQAIVPHFVLESQGKLLINRLRLQLFCDNASSYTIFDRFFTTDHFSVYTSGSNFTGFEAGYDEGYNAAWSEASNLAMREYSNGYDKGFDIGKEAGLKESQLAAKNEGYRLGLSDGYDEGFLEGKLEGISEGDYNLSFSALFFSLFDAPVKIVSGLLDFNFLGINVLQFACSVLTLVLFIWLLKVFLL